MLSSFIHYPTVAKPMPIESRLSDWDSPASKFCSFSAEVLSQILDYRDKVHALKQLQVKQISEISDSSSSTIVDHIDSLTKCLTTHQKNIVLSIEELKLLCNVHDKDEVCQVNNMNRNFKNAIKEMMRANSDYQLALRDNSVQQCMCLNPGMSESEAKDAVEALNRQKLILAIENPKLETIQTYKKVSARYKQLKDLEKSAAELNQLVDNLHNITVTHDAQFQVINQNLSSSTVDLERGDANVLSSITKSRNSKFMRSRLLAFAMIMAFLMVGTMIGSLIKWNIL